MAINTASSIASTSISTSTSTAATTGASLSSDHADRSAGKGMSPQPAGTAERAQARPGLQSAGATPQPNLLPRPAPPKGPPPASEAKPVAPPPNPAGGAKVSLVKGLASMYAASGGIMAMPGSSQPASPRNAGPANLPASFHRRQPSSQGSSPLSRQEASEAAVTTPRSQASPPPPSDFPPPPPARSGLNALPPLPTLTKPVQIGVRDAAQKAQSSREASKQRADNVAAAEYKERLERLGANSDAKARREVISMLGKSNLKWNKESVYEPVSSFMLGELQGTGFAREARAQKARLYRDFGDRPDDLVERTGDDKSSKGSKASDNLKLLAPYIDPILEQVCGSSGNYEDCPLSQSVKDQMMDIDHAFLSAALDCGNIKWGSIVTMRQNLFTGILFTRAISPFLLHPDGKPALDEAGREKPPLKVYVKLSAGTNRTFNLQWKAFSRSFVEASGRQLPPELQQRYDARVAQEMRKLQKGKKERAYRSMPTSTLPQGEDLRSAMRQEKEAHRRELENPLVPGQEDPEQAVIAAYKKTHPGSFGQRRFEKRFDELVTEWLNSEASGHEDLNAALRQIFEQAKQEWKERSPDSGKSGKASISSTTSDARGSGDKGTALATPRAREAERSVRQLKLEAEEERHRQLEKFTGHKDRRVDFKDREFKSAFQTKLNRWLSRDTGGKYLLALKKLYEETLVQHYKLELSHNKLLAGAAWDSLLDQAVGAWKAAPENRGKTLNGLLMQTFVDQLIVEQTLVVRFKDRHIDGDDDAQGISGLLDKEIAAWRASRENQGMRLNPALLDGLWEKACAKQAGKPKS